MDYYFALAPAEYDEFMEENSSEGEEFRVNNLLSFGGSGKIQKVGDFHSFPIEKAPNQIFWWRILKNKGGRNRPLFGKIQFLTIGLQKLGQKKTCSTIVQRLFFWFNLPRPKFELNVIQQKRPNPL